MEIKKLLYTVEDVWALQLQPENAGRDYELINGELFEMSPANSVHAWLASEISGFIRDFAKPRDYGFTLVEGGFSPDKDRSTLLAPDVAFVRKERMPLPFPQPYFDFMPDLAVEILSPSNTQAELSRKTAIYLENGTRMLWIVNPMERNAEVYRRTADGQIDVIMIDINGVLSGEDVLPGFTLEMLELFPEATQY